MSYSKRYYENIEREEMAQAIVLARMATELFNPKSMIDIGCGTGFYADQFPCPARKIDITPNKGVEVVDISKPVDLGKFDLAICLEVLEHIDEEFSDIAVENIKNCCNRVILSCAMPNQPGENHVNCQRQSYWEEKFGWKRDFLNEMNIVYAISKVPHTFWMLRNLMILEK